MPVFPAFVHMQAGDSMCRASQSVARSGNTLAADQPCEVVMPRAGGHDIVPRLSVSASLRDHRRGFPCLVRTDNAGCRHRRRLACGCACVGAAAPQGLGARRRCVDVNELDPSASACAISMPTPTAVGRRQSCTGDKRRWGASMNCGEPVSWQHTIAEVRPTQADRPPPVRSSIQIGLAVSLRQ